LFAIRHPETVTQISEYRDQRFQGTLKEQDLALRTSTTVYVGNLSFYTSEDQLLYTGRYRKCRTFLNRTMLDGRIIRVDYDAGFVEGRQYGRGKHGGQVRDEYREQYDPDRGGYGKIWQDRERL
ncbi:hypothetical protein OSTOST_21259, partial [Ostertagia ostertagi]